ncbi:MAG: hypothetical protein RR338_03340 [Clostridia bacterium]
MKYTVKARTSKFSFGNNFATFIDAKDADEAIKICVEMLKAKGKTIDSIHATPATEEDERRGISY